jgi:hypothetical protein
MERVSVANGPAVTVETAPWVDIDSRVWAAEVYRAFKVAAGWGVAAAKGPHARMVTRAMSGTRNFLRYLLNIHFSINSLTSP